MAGDWIKMRCGLETEPEVIAIGSELGLDEDTVIGKIYRLWSWADQHLESGNARGVTDTWLDRYIDVTGFAAALTNAGWLEHEGTGIVIPNFDRYMGQSAKRRALTAERVAKHRCNARNAPREEKSREEKKEQKKPRKKRREYPAIFERFYEAYPRKKSKGDALDAWIAMGCDEIVDKIMAALKAAKWDGKDNGTFIPYPASWLRDEGWLDEVDRAPATAPKDRAAREAQLREMVDNPDPSKTEYARNALRQEGYDVV